MKCSKLVIVVNVRFSSSRCQVPQGFNVDQCYSLSCIMITHGFSWLNFLYEVMRATLGLFLTLRSYNVNYLCFARKAE